MTTPTVPAVGSLWRHLPRCCDLGEPHIVRVMEPEWHDDSRVSYQTDPDGIRVNTSAADFLQSFEPLTPSEPTP